MKAPDIGRAFKQTGIRLLYVLLCNPGLENRTYRKIATDTDVALGMVNWVMRELKQLGFLLEVGKGRGREIRLINKERLLERWITAYAEQLRPKLPSYGWNDPMWIHDYPRAERNLLKLLQETTLIGPGDDDYDVLTLDDPELMKYPIAYICEVGAWNPDALEAKGLHDYLLKGGFLIVDDFRGERDLDYFVRTFQRVIPGAQFIQLDGSHEVFDSFFEVDPHEVIPPYGPRTPVWYGVFEGNDPTKRLMMIVNYDNDIGEYWEWSGTGFYPIDLSNEGYKVAIDYIIYGMTH